LLLGKIYDIPGFLVSLDIAVLSSRAEGMPNSVLEYMAAGRPAVVTRVGDAPLLIQHQVRGLVANPQDAPDIAAKLELLLRDRAWAAELAMAGRRYVRERYPREVGVARFETFLRELAVCTARF